ncbi:TetR/AcrR family transcriptional regulator [Streptosporangium lutulentum]
MSRQLTAYDAKRPALTKRGEATRRRILEAATDLIFDQGATSTTLDEVRAVTRTSKSQLYHYFADKSDLVRAVIEHQTQRMIDAQRPLIDEIESFEDLVAWRDHLVTLQRDRRCGAAARSVRWLASSPTSTRRRAWTWSEPSTTGRAISCAD